MMSADENLPKTTAMAFDKIRTIECEVSFLPAEESKRPVFSTGAFSTGSYRPHLVVEDARITDSTSKDSVPNGEYLGVVFVDGPEEIEMGKPLRVQLALIYESAVDYSKLIPSAEFTIREGPRVVGYGKVL